MPCCFLLGRRDQSPCGCCRRGIFRESRDTKDQELRAGVVLGTSGFYMRDVCDQLHAGHCQGSLVTSFRKSSLSTEWIQLLINQKTSSSPPGRRRERHMGPWELGPVGVLGVIPTTLQSFWCWKCLTAQPDAIPCWAIQWELRERQCPIN